MRVSGCASEARKGGATDAPSLPRPAHGAARGRGLGRPSVSPPTVSASARGRPDLVFVGPGVASSALGGRTRGALQLGVKLKKLEGLLGTINTPRDRF